MKLSAITCSIIFCGLIGFTGCKKQDEPKSDPAGSGAAASEEGSHVHADGTEHAAHDGHAAGPHGGTVVDWGGGEYHVEFTVDHDKQEATVYILGSDEKSPVLVDAKSIDLSISDPVMQVTLAAAPQEGDPAGETSRFVGTHEKFSVVKEYSGTIVGVIDGTPFSGDFEEEAHDDGGHAHSHAGNDALVWEGEPKKHSGLLIQLGHHGQHLHAGEEVEPAVSIARGGKPVADAKVFNALVSADGETVLAKEVATVYEPATKTEPAHYAQGALAIPAGVAKVILRYRIVIADGEPVTFDVPVDVE